MTRIRAAWARLRARREDDIWNTYQALAHLGPTSLIPLRRHLGIRAGRVARALAHLHHRGWITSTWPDGDDITTYSLNADRHTPGDQT